MTEVLLRQKKQAAEKLFLILVNTSFHLKNPFGFLKTSAFKKDTTSSTNLPQLLILSITIGIKESLQNALVKL